MAFFTRLALVGLIAGGLTVSAQAMDRSGDKAAKHFDAALGLAAKQSPRTWYERAIKKLDAGRALCEQSQDVTCMANYYFTLGQVQKTAYADEEAMAAFKEARSIFAELGFRKREAGVVFELGNAYLVAEDVPAACGLYEEARRLYQEGIATPTEGDEDAPINPQFATFDQMVAAFEQAYCS